jgi:outer membrane protein insertion porin family
MITHRRLHSSAILAGIFLFAAASLPIHSFAAQNLLPKKIKAVKIIGNDRTKDYVFRRELSSVIGRPFEQDYLDLAYNRLDRLGIFSGITITPVEEEDGIVLRVEVKETFPILPSVSLSISDENGIQFGGGVKALNLKGEAITMSARALFGGATNLEFRMSNPWITGDKLAYSLDFYYRDRHNAVFDFREKSFEVFTTFSRQSGDSVNYGGRLNFQYLKSDVPGKTLSQDNADFVPNLAIFIGYDTRDSWSNPHTGWWNEVEVLKSGFLTGQSDFWRINFDLRRYQPLAARQTLALFSLLTLTTGTIGRDVAVWQQFGVGGSNSIRGWDLGERVGKNQFLNSIEYRYNVLEPRTFKIFGFSFYLGAQVAAFADIGHVWSERDDFRLGSFLGGAGVGLRLIVPYVGLTRFDLAWGQPGMSVRLYLGGYEKPVKQRERVR